MLEILNMVGVVIFVIFFFGFCVFIHELGHFLAAKWCGLHINAFSIGFKKAWGKEIDGIDYRIGWLPFGGYVDLPQVDATGSDIQDQHGNPLPPGAPMHRIITAVAGPLFNILFGLALGVVIWIMGVPQSSPRVNSIKVTRVLEHGPSYRAGLRDGDKIVEMNGTKINVTWEDFLNNFIVNVGEMEFVIDRDGKQQTIKYQPEVNPENSASVSENIYFPFFDHDAPVLVFPLPGSLATEVGIKAGDVIKKVNGEVVKNKIHFIRMVAGYKPKEITVELMRGQELVTIGPFKTRPIGSEESKPRYSIGADYTELKYQLEGVQEGSIAYNAGLRNSDLIEKINGKEVYGTLHLESIISPQENKHPVSFELKRAGELVEVKNVTIGAEEQKEDTNEIKVVYKREIEIVKTLEDSPAAKAGLKVGDIVTAVNGTKLVETGQLSGYEAGSKGQALKLRVLREGKEMDISVTPELRSRHGMGVDMQIIGYPTPWQQFTDVVDKSYRTLKGVGAGIKHKMGLSTKKSSLKISNFSGPLGIVGIIWRVVYSGSYLKGLAIIVMITFSLGLLNLMPLPVLDGGHIVMAFIQLIIRRPLPARIVQPLMTGFAFLLISFMIYVTVYDVKRMFGWSVGEDEKTTGTTLIVSS